MSSHCWHPPPSAWKRSMRRIEKPRVLLLLPPCCARRQFELVNNRSWPSHMNQKMSQRLDNGRIKKWNGERERERERWRLNEEWTPLSASPPSSLGPGLGVRAGCMWIGGDFLSSPLAVFNCGRGGVVSVKTPSDEQGTREFLIYLYIYV